MLTPPAVLLVVEGGADEATDGSAQAHHRGRAGLSQEQLAEAVGLTQPTLSRIERGLSQPDFYTLCELEDQLGLERGDLACHTEEALTQAQRAAQPGVDARSGGGGGPWWAVALGIAGFAGLVGFVVASLLEEGDDDEDDLEDP